MPDKRQISSPESNNSGRYKKISEAETRQLREEKINVDQCWSDYHAIGIELDSGEIDPDKTYLEV
ncbi:hypothetical protein GF336_05705 [Candidatus Woesearchaeota archaeon]|nr:hypothetical protein [Candidatus Woesearchaeota archaeon]